MLLQTVNDMNSRAPQIKKYTIHILAIRALSPDTVDLPPEQK